MSRVLNPFSIGAMCEYDPESDRPFHRPGVNPSHLSPHALTPHGLADYSPRIAATGCGPETHPTLDALFHAPPLPPSSLSPRIFPGANQASTEALIKALSDNHVSWHIFNYKGFHKYAMHRNIPISIFDLTRSHAAHHILAIWALGAPTPAVEAGYGTHCEYQRPAFASPGFVNIHNLYKHLDDERYGAHLNYFTSELLQKGLERCPEEYTFSPEANFGAEFPEMLSRLVEGALHPPIHVGYGAEFSSIGISAEGQYLYSTVCDTGFESAVTGLAMTTVQSSNSDLVPRAWFPDIISSVSTRGGNRTALSIVALVSCDPRFSRIQRVDEESIYSKRLTEHGSIIHDYVDMWKFDISTEEGIADAIEELSWANVRIYGVGGFSG